MEARFRKNTQYHRQVHLFSKKLLCDFQKSSNNFFKFNLFSVCIFFIELLLAIYLIQYYSDTSVIALFIALFSLTLFSYLILFFYFYAKKPDQFEGLKDRFLRSCRSCLSPPQGQIEHHLSICSAISFLVDDLKSLPKSKSVKKLSRHFSEEDIFLLKEMLFISSKEELLKQIRHTPTDIEIHSALANTYVKLSSLYKEQKEKCLFWGNRKRQKKKILGIKFTTAIQRAIEEFQILNDLSPNDPWVHAQLAKSYKELGMLQKEMIEYENILKLRPSDLEILFECALCYFKLGYSAKGLQAYETLKKAHFIRSDDLLNFYGTENLKIEDDL